MNINLAIVGAKESGKSALTVRFLTKRFIGEYDSQADFCVTRHISYLGKEADVHFKDTTGSDWVKGPSALIGWSNAFVIVYSITDRRGFELASFMLERLNIAKRLHSSTILLLANKNDLDHLRNVTHEEGRMLAEKHNIHFSETSAAADSDGVSMIFKKLIYQVIGLQSLKGDTVERVKIKRPSFIRRDSPTHRSNSSTEKRSSFKQTKSCLISKSSLENENSLLSRCDSPLQSISSNSRCNSPSLSTSSSSSDSDNIEFNVTVCRENTKTDIGLISTTKRRKISLPTFISRTVQPQKYLNNKTFLNKTR